MSLSFFTRASFVPSVVLGDVVDLVRRDNVGPTLLRVEDQHQVRVADQRLRPERYGYLKTCLFGP